MKKKKERWSWIKGYKTLYRISTWGRIKSYHRRKVVIMTTSPDGSGYCKVDLCKNKYKKKYRVHRLVGVAFIPNPSNKPEINHKDEIKTNNYVDNLEWATPLENNTHNNIHLRNGKLLRKPINQLSLSSVLIKRWDSATTATKHGFNGSCIYACCSGSRKHHKGFKWEHA